MAWFIKLLKPKLYIFIFLLLSCISLQRGIRSNLTYSAENIAVYELEESPIRFSDIGSVNRIPVDEKLLKSILLTIRKEKSILSFYGKELLWDYDTIDELTPIIKDILKPTKKGKTFFLIVKAEDRLAPYSRIFRTTLYLNRDGNVLQLIFGEVNMNINFGSQFSFQDWANPSFFKITCEKKKEIFFEGKLESAFQYKSLSEKDIAGSWSLTSTDRNTSSKTRYKTDSSCADNSITPSKSLDGKQEIFIHYKWIQIDLDKALAQFKNPNSNENTGNQKIRENRLKELMDLYNKGLINKEDYEIKKAEVLGEL